MRRKSALPPIGMLRPLSILPVVFRQELQLTRPRGFAFGIENLPTPRHLCAGGVEKSSGESGGSPCQHHQDPRVGKHEH